ncbi:hypothetical protein ACFC8N_43455 [Streptomyces sp. NPDC055966]|uniref:hypothetical protein n=1 Tax=Streptomyces sp. NPDC055966 TaxID=3345669 RepID=UPI0035D80A51
MDPFQEGDYVDVYRRFDSGPATADLTGLLVVRVPASDDPLPAVQPYRRVHAFTRRWQVTGLLAELHDRLRNQVRQKDGRSPDPTAAVVDSQSLRAAANIPRSTSGWDGGKKVRGRYLEPTRACPSCA